MRYSFGRSANWSIVPKEPPTGATGNPVCPLDDELLLEELLEDELLDEDELDGSPGDGSCWPPPHADSSEADKTVVNSPIRYFI